jgi:molybdopterin converting factor small subunit
VQITVRLYAGLSRLRPPTAPPLGPFPWDTADAATISQVAAELGIPTDLLRICVVNGQQVGKDHGLAPGDHLALVPASAGG